LSGDLNGDGAVDVPDAAILIGDFGIIKSVPTVVTSPGIDPELRSKIIQEIKKRFETPHREIKQNSD